MYDIHLLKPYLDDKEPKYVLDCLQNNWISSVGKYIELFEQKVADFTQSPFAVAVSSGTAALHLALKVLGVGKNDMVILPNLSFVASANAITYCGAEPLFVDIRPDTWQMDSDLLASFLEEHCELKNNKCYLKSSQKVIKAMLVVHILGNMPDMEAIMKLAQSYHLQVVEDAAEALGSFYQQTHAGTIADVGVLSFNGNKIVTTGNGGMVLCKDAEIAKKVKYLANQAKSDNEEYYHDEIGYNYRIQNTSAAIGLAQMEKIAFFLEEKQKIFDFYRENLSENFVFQKFNAKVKSNHWLHTVLCKRSRELQKYLRSQKIQTRKLWYPLNRLPMYQSCFYLQGQDFTWQIYEQSLSLPSSVGISEAELNKIKDGIRLFEAELV